MTDAVTLTVPLPPPALRANNRTFWARKSKAANEYSEDVWWAWRGQYCGIIQHTFPDAPLDAANVHYEWRYAGVEPDHSNLGGHTKYLQDILCLAPKMSLERAVKYTRTHLGLVADDKGIHATYEAVKVPKRHQECVVVTVTRRDDR